MHTLSTLSQDEVFIGAIRILLGLLCLGLVPQSRHTYTRSLTDKHLYNSLHVRLYLSLLYLS